MQKNGAAPQIPASVNGNLLPADSSSSGSFYSAKDLARMAGLSVKTIIRWSRKLKIPPTLRGQSSNRWSEADARRLFAAWEAWQAPQPHHD